MRHARFPAGNSDAQPEWLRFLRKVNAAARNAAAPMVFGAPIAIEQWWAGGTVERYEEANVIDRPDGSVSVVALTDRAAALFDAAAES